ncbi:cell division protein FtsQ/DivIB [Streptococcus suis]
MADIDSKHENVSKLEQIREFSSFENLENTPIKETRPSATTFLGDSNIPQMDAPDDEKSAFFEQWKAKHEAYLASLEETKEPVQEIGSVKKSRLFQGIGKARETKVEKTTNKPTPLPSSVFLKSLPVLGVSIAMAALALYFISPTSKNKQLEVTGNQHLSVEQVENYSLISPNDYILTTALYASNYAENIKKSSSSVESATISYQFPNKFIIHIQEYAGIGYILEQNQYYLVLASGDVASETTSEDALPESFTTINLTDRELIKNLAIELGKLDAETRSKIQTINLTPSSATADLLTFNMTDGNTVLVPLSEVSQKMIYYEKIAAEVTSATTIDMEVGIYRYAT